MHYQIELAGHLTVTEAAWFDGSTVTHTARGTTLLTGSLADQSAFHGMLNTILALGLNLIALTAFRTPADISSYQD